MYRCTVCISVQYVSVYSMYRSESYIVNRFTLDYWASIGVSIITLGIETNTVFTLGKCNLLVWFGAVRYSY